MQRKIESIGDMMALFAEQYLELRDPTQTIDHKRQRLALDSGLAVLEAFKVQVAYAAIFKGSLELPCIEAQTTERPHTSKELPGPPKTAEQRVLESGPSANHPFRNIHRMKK